MEFQIVFQNHLLTGGCYQLASNCYMQNNISLDVYDTRPSEGVVKCTIYRMLEIRIWGPRRMDYATHVICVLCTRSSRMSVSIANACMIAPER